ncbi:MAG: type II secretion system F family protein, partial [Planctomycetes bacterium]|nr:type II secretion system F family protein [Planctomycetota bacterium]
MSTAGGRQISLDQLTALNDEMAALARAGVPLEIGLSGLARDLPGRLGELADRLRRRLESGQSLEQVLEKDRESFPPVWRAVVLAGLRSGRLTAALERLSITARRLAERRRLFGLALVYPIVVLVLASVLFVMTAIYVLPMIDWVYQDLTGRSDPLLQVLTGLGVWWVVPLVLLAVLILVIGWRRAGRTDLKRVPGRTSRSSRHDGRIATMAEVLALLVRQQVPLDESVVLAAEASGDSA